MWHTLPSSSSTAPSQRYGLPPELGMFVVAPATSFHHPHAAHPDPSLISAADPSHSHNVGVIPLLAASIDDVGDFSGSRGGRQGAIQLWQDQPHQQSGYMKKGGSINFDNNSAAAANLLNPGGGSIPASGSGTMTCQDCGNQAKKDCSHRRCRTCCKSRGFDCSTHVKSTWVPAARRRERQVMAAATGTGGGASSGSTSGAKKPRLISSQNTATTSHTSTSNTPPRSFETSSSHQDAGFKESLPGQVRAPAVFKCVKVTAVDDGDDEYAYQAVVKIGGHVFKGFLYDQGAESREGIPNLSELHLGGGSSGGGGGRAGVSSSSPMMDPAEVYGGSGGGLLGGSNYGNSIN